MNQVKPSQAKPSQARRQHSCEVMLRQVRGAQPLVPVAARDQAALDGPTRARAAARAAGLPEARFAVLHWLAMYIDDTMGASADDLLFDQCGAPVLDATGAQLRRAQAHFEAARRVLTAAANETAEQLPHGHVCLFEVAEVVRERFERVATEPPAPPPPPATDAWVFQPACPTRREPLLDGRRGRASSLDGRHY